MTSTPLTASRTAALLQLLAAWLAALLLMQAFQGALALGAGPRHLHRPDAAAVHGAAHLHLAFERHHHRLDDTTVQRADTADSSLEAAQLALTLAMAAMVPMAFGQGLRRLLALAQVLRPAPTWFWRHRSLHPPLRPPRAA
jgi:hypothetical protein